ncbi:MAG: DNA-binding response regulator [Piscirickettsiaceae bacterium]|nr:MAG: DNA-binding response regulator [Piscirickettsiaceae bacterium]
MKVLIIEDDAEAAYYLVKGLTESGYVVEHALDGDEGLRMALSADHDVLLIDRMLPKRDGLSIVKILRADGLMTPVLILSALGEIDDRVEGLRMGGDDYLVKPYAFSELLARIEALIRRGQSVRMEDKLIVADLQMNLINHKVYRAGKPIYLQPREQRLLEYFMRHANQIVTRTMLLEQVWGFHFDPETNVIDTQISRLRQKIDKNFPTPLLKTIRSKGYIFGESE